MSGTRRPIALVGLSGAGKSTTARALAARLGWPVVDTDACVAERAGRPVAAIFGEQGEDYFRELEAMTLAEALTAGPRVVATGGGVVLRAASRALLRERAFVAWLDAPDLALIERLRTDADERPLLAGDALARLAIMRAARAPLYAEVAHLTVQTAGLSPGEVAALILRDYGED
ncbi:MAG: shikimate kinase [Chloroflexi bacterium OHK40]